jgi:membrane fusion protein (multidrug efflux system)
MGEAVQTVDLRARVQGFLREVSFREGHDVKAGDVLFQIEFDQPRRRSPRPRRSLPAPWRP